MISESIELTEPIWMRQSGESSRWYDRFHRYMLVGARRSLLGCVRVEQAEKGGKKRTSKTPSSWDKASTQFCWKERALAWDEYQRSIDREQWERNYKELRQSAWEMSREHLKRHEQMMKLPLFEQELTRDNNGNLVSVTVKPARWSYKDILATAQAAIELGAFAIGDVEAAERLLVQLSYVVSLQQEDNATIEQFVTEESPN